MMRSDASRKFYTRYSVFSQTDVQALEFFIRVARYNILKPKIPIGYFLEGLWNRQYWYVFVAIWNILQPFR
jgi:hypothetical protein